LSTGKTILLKLIHGFRMTEDLQMGDKKDTLKMHRLSRIAHLINSKRIVFEDWWWWCTIEFSSAISMARLPEKQI